jgi:hypothetical protein
MDRPAVGFVFGVWCRARVWRQSRAMKSAAPGSPVCFGGFALLAIVDLVSQDQ